MALVIVNPFEGYSKGNLITDAAEERRVLAGEHAPNVMRVPDEAADTHATPADAGHQEG